MTEKKESSKTAIKGVNTEVTAYHILSFGTIVAVVWFGVRLSISGK
jgi:hypothetical protein